MISCWVRTPADEAHTLLLNASPARTEFAVRIEFVRPLFSGDQIRSASRRLRSRHGWPACRARRPGGDVAALQSWGSISKIFRPSGPRIVFELVLSLGVAGSSYS